MAKRIAFVVNSQTGAELTGGENDARLVYETLLKGDIGCCDPSSPEPLIRCPSRRHFEESLHALLKTWSGEDQLILYFSGHGKVSGNKKYALEFGTGDDKTLLPFDNIVSDLLLHGVHRAILILDACHSGMIVQGEKSSPPLPFESQDLPKGVALIASSRSQEYSYELSDGTTSIFTHFLALGLNTGLKGTPTDNNLIGIDDIVSFITEQIESSEYASRPQRPVYCIRNAEKYFWLAKNISKKFEPKPKINKTKPAPSKIAVHSIEDLRTLYENTEESRHPCMNATIDDLDWELIETYIKNAGIPNLASLSAKEKAKRLSFYSPVSKAHLHKAAVLCFAHRPETFIPQARAIVVQGNLSNRSVNRIDVVGPLPKQYKQLVSIVEKELLKIPMERDEAFRKFLSATREGISNAITHRSYTSNDLLRVVINERSLEILSPGAFPYENLHFLHAEEGYNSSPTDAAIAWYLTNTLAYEGIGRGFQIFREYIEHTQEDFLQFQEVKKPTLVKLKISLNTSDSNFKNQVIDSPLTILKSPQSFPKIKGYVLKEYIASGGMSSVYLAQSTRPDDKQQYAIKIISLRFDSDISTKRFEREIEITAALSHPYIAKTFGAGQVNDQLFIVMEYLSGGTLRSWIKNHYTDSNNRFYFSKVAYLLSQVATGLGFAHSRQIIHRDLKPENILISEDETPKIIDFGIAKRLEASVSHTITGEFTGTLLYLSPESFITYNRMHPSDDIYSLGMIMYEMMTLKPPYEGSFQSILHHKVTGTEVDPKIANPAIPDALAQICKKATAPRAQNRYQDAQEFHRDLMDYINNPEAAQATPTKKSLFQNIQGMISSKIKK